MQRGRRGERITAHELVEELSGAGVKLWADGDKLRCRGPRRVITPDTVARLEEHKAAILEALEGGEKPGQNSDPVIESAGEVLALARAHFGEIAPESRQEAPYAAPEPGRDPLAHKHTDKALWFAGSRERELERRRRYGLPSHIRLVDGGGAA
ncbi:MAG: hypothetical protein M3R38_33355 [Actinomycetota bacterium]|nr:hypothetical protein [Actinomycetota bacterium]